MTVSHCTRGFLANSAWLSLLSAVSVLAISCADPEGAFNEFADREAALSDAGTGGTGGNGGNGGTGGTAGTGVGGASGGGGESGTGGTGGGGTCTPLTQAEVANGYLFTLSAVILPNKAFVADCTITMDEANNTISMSVQPLRADDKTTPVGAAILGGPFQIQPDGSFNADFGNITMAGDANPISGSDLVTTLTLIAEPGGWCSESTFVCGAAVGQATKPISLNLEGSTFTFQRLDGSGYPSPVINCAGDIP
jgi:hypothetical protein